MICEIILAIGLVNASAIPKIKMPTSEIFDFSIFSASSILVFVYYLSLIQDSSGKTAQGEKKVKLYFVFKSLLSQLVLVSET